MKRIYSFFAALAMLLFSVSGTVFAQDKTDSDLSSVGATGYTNVRRGSGSSSALFGACTVQVLSMPSGDIPGFVAITEASNNTGTDTYWYISAYFTDKSGRKFLVCQITDNVFSKWTNAKEIWLNYFASTYFTGTKPLNTFDYDFEIGSRAFNGCSSLQKFGAYSGSNTRYIDCKRIGSNAFKGCSSMTECLVKATKNGFINADAFSGCSSLSSTLYLSGSINKTAFEGCTSVKTIYWYGGDSHAYSYSSESPMYPMRKSVETITIYGSVPAHFFEDFTALKEVKSPSDFFDNLKNTNIYYMGVGEKGFGYCSSLESVQVAGQIAPDAFQSCPKLTSITYRGGWLANSQIPTSESGSFFYSVRNSVTSFTIEETSTTNVPNTYIPSYLCYGMSKLTSVSIPSYVLAIGEGAFKGCSGLKSVSFNKTASKLTLIGPYAFMDCSALTTITLPVALEYIYDEAFSWCDNLNTCPLTKDHTNLRHIGHAAFYQCGISSLYIPANVTSLGGMLTGGSRSKVTKIEFMPANLTRTSVGGSWADLFVSTLDLYSKERNAITEIRVSNDLATIPDSLFYDYKGLVQVLNNEGSAWLNNVAYVGKSAFQNCEKMWGEGYITQLVNATYVGESAFEGSNFNGSIKFDALQTIEKRAFANTQLMYMHDLGTLPKLKTIGEEAFASNAKLEKASFNVVTKIGERAFANNSKLKEISITNEIPAIESNSFENCNIEKITTNCKVIDALKANTDWLAVCANIVNLENSYTYPSHMDDFWCTKSTMKIEEEVNCEGVFVVRAIPNEGCEFVYWNDGNTDNPRTIDLNEYTDSWLWSIAASEDDYHQTNFSTTPEGAGYLEITNQYGHDRRNQKFIVGEQAQLTPKENNGWYQFDHWDYEHIDMVEDPSPCDMEYNPNQLCVYINYTMDAGGGESGGYIDPETGEWIPVSEPVEPEMRAAFDENLKAVFVLKEMLVNVQQCSDGNGSVALTEDPNQMIGSVIHLTATPKEGYMFDQWSDGSTDAERTLTIEPKLLTADDGVTVEDVWDGATLRPYNPSATYTLNLCASFKVDPNYKQKFTITVLCDETMGTVTGGGVYEEGTQVTLTATPKEGFDFLRWDDDVTESSRTITVTENAVYNAEFTIHINYFTITVKADPEEGGMVSGGGKYAENEDVELVAEAHDGFEFIQWADGVKEAKRTVKVTKDETFTAQFKKLESFFTITVVSENEEMGTVMGGGTFKEGEQASFGAIAKDGYEFVQWSDGNTDNPRTITVTKDETFTAQFKKKEAPSFTITVVSENEEMGTVMGGGTFKEGEQASFAAIAKDGYEFVQWSDGNTDNPRTIIVEKDETFTAQFKVKGEGLDDLNAETMTARKVMINGTIFIRQGDKLFTLQGQEVK